MGLFLTILVCLAFLSIYWAALYQPNVHVHKLQGVVVPYDNGIVGQTVVQACAQRARGHADQLVCALLRAATVR